jgi:hypothetical protein
MVRHISAALLSTTTVLGLITGISGVTVLTLVQGHTLWWMYVLGVLTFVIVTLTDALRRATSTTNTAETGPQQVVRAVGGAGGSGDHGGQGGAGGSNYIGRVG